MNLVASLKTYFSPQNLKNGQPYAEAPWKRKWQPTPEFLSGKSHGQRSEGSQRLGHNLANQHDVSFQILKLNSVDPLNSKHLKNIAPGPTVCFLIF